MRTNKSVSMAKNKSIGGAEKFDTSNAERCSVSCGGGGGRWIQSGGKKQSNMIARVGLHDITSRDRPICFFYFATRLLYC